MPSTAQASIAANPTQATWRLDPAHGRVHRVPELDGLRGLAALAVIGYHVAPNLVPFGWAAVDLFFVLSGYLITSIILREGHQPGFLRRFYIRRGLRIWPIYYLTIVGLMIAHKLQWLPTGCRWSGLWPYLTYTQNLPDYWGGKSPVFHPWLRHTWTLAIEEQFYLLWPALLLVVAKGNARRVVVLALVCLAGSVAARLGGVRMTLLLGRLDGLALGALLSAVVRFAFILKENSNRTYESKNVLIRHMAALSLAIAASGLFAIHHAGQLGLYGSPSAMSLTILLANLAAFGLVALVVDQAQAGWLRPLRAGWLVLIGQMSYGLYLYHPIVLGISAGTLRLSRTTDLPIPRLVVTLAACLALATLSWFLIERPLLALKDHLAPSPVPTPTPHLNQASPNPARSVTGASTP